MTPLNRLRRILQDNYEVDPEQVTPETSVLDFLDDSLEVVELANIIEAEFEIDVTDDMLARWTTVGDVLKDLPTETARADYPMGYDTTHERDMDLPPKWSDRDG